VSCAAAVCINLFVVQAHSNAAQHVRAARTARSSRMHHMAAGRRVTNTRLTTSLPVSCTPLSSSGTLGFSRRVGTTWPPGPGSCPSRLRSPAA
jgi:hypothetical protein